MTDEYLAIKEKGWQAFAESNTRDLKLAQESLVLQALESFKKATTPDTFNRTTEYNLIVESGLTMKFDASGKAAIARIVELRDAGIMKPLSVDEIFVDTCAFDFGRLDAWLAQPLLGVLLAAVHGI